MNKKRVLLLALLFVAAKAWPVQLTLAECIALARSQSVDAAVARGELKAAYWEWRSYRADLLPEVTLNGTLPSYNRRYTDYLREDGSHAFVRNDYLGVNGTLTLTQKVWPTGGTISVETSLDYLRQCGGMEGQGGSRNQFMSVPVSVTLNQPLFGVNAVRWSRRIEPVRYRRAQADYLSQTEQVAMQAIALFFSLLMADEQVGIANQNLQTAERLYVVAEAKREMGSLSQNDLLQMQMNVLTARSALTTARSDRQSAQFALRTFLDVDTDIQPVAPTEVPEVQLSYDEVLAHAQQNHSTTHALQLMQLQADRSVAYARANLRSVNLFAQVGYTGTDRTLGGAYRQLRSRDVVQVGVSVPLLDWGKRRGQLRVAESNREIVRGQVRQQEQEFRHNLFVLTEQFNNQREQLRLAEQADTIARRRYQTNVETFKIGTLSTLELSDAQTAKDVARLSRLRQLYDFWYYYYRIRSLTLWDFEHQTNIQTDFEKLIK